MRLHIIAAGRLKKGPLYDLCQEYQKRITWNVQINEIESRHKTPLAAQAEEHEKIMNLLKVDAFIVALDQRGDALGSVDFAKTLEKSALMGKSEVQFVIGGADGLNDSIRKRADLVLSFGAQTWPHMLARVMLLEQIYRAQQIRKGHPYHRD